MRISSFVKSLIKSYPMTLLALILLFAGIATIFLESKVYAVNKEGCDCKSNCNPPSYNTYPTVQYPCPQKYYYNYDKCECNYDTTIYYVMSGIWTKCLPEDGCGCCDTSDCDPSCKNQCRIYTYRLFCFTVPDEEVPTMYDCLFCHYKSYKVVNDEPQKEWRECVESDCQ